MNTRMAKAYVRHMLTARNAHALHSPFLFKLYNEAIRHRATPEIMGLLRLRRDVQRDGRTITMEDFGAGSRAGMDTVRTVKSIASNSGVPSRYGAVLYRLARFTEAQNILELGTSVGLGTAFLATAVRDNPTGAKVASIDASRATQKIAREYLEKLSLTEYVELLTGTFDDMLPEHLAACRKYDLVYIHGDHRYRSTLRYFEWLLPHLHEESVVVLDEIHSSRPMERAWDQLCQHHAVRQSIDLYRFGLLFFRPNQLSEHFRLRL